MLTKTRVKTENIVMKYLFFIHQISQLTLFLATTTLAEIFSFPSLQPGKLSGEGGGVFYTPLNVIYLKPHIW